MGNTRLMNKAEDYKKLGVKPGQVENWEDGRRDDSRPGSYEWWYFDAVLDDGTKIVIYYGDKFLNQVFEQGPFPYVELKVTLPDGTLFDEAESFKPSDGILAADHCDFKVGGHRLTGDLREYQVLVSPINGLGVDLKLTNIGSSWRPGTAYFGFTPEGEEDEDQYFTWLCAVPRGKVEGTLTIQGETKHVTGFGYHDHQWGNVYPSFVWNHWTWARQSFGDYSVLMFDFNAVPMYGGGRHTICFIQDKDGNTVFENDAPAKYEVFEEYVQPETGKEHPRRARYIMENGGKKVEYTLSAREELEVRDDTKLVGDEMLAVLTGLGLSPSYTRYFGTGDLVLTDGDDVKTFSGELIYEFVYSGKTYKI